MTRRQVLQTLSRFRTTFVICGNQLAFLRPGLQGKICCPCNSTMARAKESTSGPTKIPMTPNAFAPPSRAEKTSKVWTLTCARNIYGLTNTSTSPTTVGLWNGTRTPADRNRPERRNPSYQGKILSENSAMVAVAKHFRFCCVRSGDPQSLKATLSPDSPQAAM